MTGLRFECYLPAGTDSLSVVLPAQTDHRVGIEGSSLGWLGTGYRGTPLCGHGNSVNPPRPATAVRRRGGAHRWISAKYPAATDVLVQTR
jgi:hypothetical protein